MNITPTKEASAKLTDQFQEEICRRGYTHLGSAEIRTMLGVTNNDVVEIQDYYDDLRLDGYLKSGVRQRAYGECLFLPETGEIKPQRPRPFYQAPNINSVAGGIKRSLPVLSDQFYQTPVFRRLVGLVSAILPLKKAEWSVGVHLMRVRAHLLDGPIASPTPEMIHRDGHEYVSQTLVLRDPRIVGGISGIYGANKEPICFKQMRSPLETIVVDDAVVWHDVSPLLLDDLSVRAGAFRSMLIMDWN